MLRIPSVLRRADTNAAVRVRAQNIIVGGGCSIASGSSIDVDLWEDFIVDLPLCFFGFVGSGGETRIFMILSGGLQRR